MQAHRALLEWYVKRPHRAVVHPHQEVLGYMMYTTKYLWPLQISSPLRRCFILDEAASGDGRDDSKAETRKQTVNERKRERLSFRGSHQQKVQTNRPEKEYSFKIQRTLFAYWTSSILVCISRLRVEGFLEDEISYIYIRDANYESIH